MTRDVRSRVDLVLLAVVILAAALHGVPGTAIAWRPLTITAVLFAPGWVVLQRLPTLPTQLFLSLVVAVSLAIEAALASVMVWTHLWHPVALGLALAAWTVVSLTLRVIGRQSRGSHSR